MKNKMLKIIFILSFIPYIYLLYSIFFGRPIVNGVELQGTERIIEMVKSVFDDFLPFTLSIFSVCLTFQMCYIFRKKLKNVFKCTFIPCLLAILFAIKCSHFGVTFLGDTVYYGFEGFKIGLISICGVFIIFPIFPVCLVFQVWLLKQNWDITDDKK